MQSIKYNKEKKCSRCKEWKIVKDCFYIRADGTINTPCKVCQLAKHKEKYAADPEAGRQKTRDFRAKNKDYRYMATFGITHAEYEAMYQNQDGKCAICRKPETRVIKGKLSTLPVDHDHQTGKVRELLCHKCNTAIGLLGDDIDLVQKVIFYLEKHQ